MRKETLSSGALKYTHHGNQRQGHLERPGARGWASHLCRTPNLRLLSTVASFIDPTGVHRAGAVCPALGKRPDPVPPRRGCPAAEKAELTGVVGRCSRATVVERAEGAFASLGRARGT